jgi:peroxiredoxin
MELLDNLLGTGEPTVKVGEVAPEFDLPDRSGKRVRLSGFRG